MIRAALLVTLLIGCSPAAPEPANPTPPGGAAPTEPGTAEAPSGSGGWSDESDEWREDPAAPAAPAEPAAPARPAQPAAAGAPSADMQAVLAAHNQYRAQHCAGPLTWSPKIAKVAQAWADHLRDAGCKFEHSNGTTLGENLAAGSPGALTPKGVVDMWYEEIKAYDWNNPRFGMNTGHFTQVVWAGTSELGCGTAQCNGMTLWVCNYAAAGNMQGAFAANVKPKGCK